MKEHPIIFNTENVKAILDGKKTQTRRVVTPYTSIVGEGRVDWSKFDWEGTTEFDFGDMCYSTESEYVPDELKGQKIGIKKAPLPLVDGRADETYPYEHQYLHVPWNWGEDATIFRIYPKWDVGDSLWVRETHYRYGHWIKNGKTKTGRQRWRFKAGAVRVPDPHYVYYMDNPPKAICKEKGDVGWFKRPSIFMPRWASRITLEITGVRGERVQEITEEDAKAEGIQSAFVGGITTLAHQDYYKYRPAFIELWNSLNAKRGYGFETNCWVWVIGFGGIGVRLK